VLGERDLLCKSPDTIWHSGSSGKLSLYRPKEPTTPFILSTEAVLQASSFSSQKEMTGVLLLAYALNIF